MLLRRLPRSLIALPLLLSACSPSGAPPRGPATGDLTGQYPAPTVRAVQGQPVATAVPQPGDVLTWNGTQWKGASSPYRPVAAGVFGVNGTASGPVLGGLRFSPPNVSGNERSYRVSFPGYRKPDAGHSYVVTVQILGASSTTVSIGTFADQFFAIFVVGMSGTQVIMLEIKEIQSS